VTKSGTPLKALRTARPILLSLIGIPPCPDIYRDGYSRVHNTQANHPWVGGRLEASAPVPLIGMDAAGA
jgi:hypothetical protein